MLRSRILIGPVHFTQIAKSNLNNNEQKMKKVEVFDPALCCSTGVCGPSPDQQLIAFAAVAKALAGKAEIVRHNLAQEPTAFSANAIVQGILQEDGTEALPALLIDGKLAMKGVYPSKEQLEQLLGLPSEESACCAPGDDQDTCCAPGSDEDDSCCSPQDNASSSCC